MTPRLPLRVGVLSDSDSIPRWLAEALEESASRGIAQVVLIVERDSGEAPASRSPFPVRLWRNRARVGFALLRRIDALLARTPAPEWRSLSALAPDATCLLVRPETSRHSDTILPADVARIREYRLDVLVRAGFRILRGEILNDAAALGIWSFHHGDTRTSRGGPPGVWEVLEDRFVTGVTLQRLTENLDGGVVLARSVGATRRFSFARNSDALYPRSARLLVRSLERAYAGSDPRQTSARDDPAWDAYAAPLYREPSNRDLFRLVPRLAARALSWRALWGRRRSGWSLAWHFDHGVAGDAPQGALYRYREIRSPRGRVRADPFVVRDAERWWMFFEEAELATSRGVIQVWEMGPDGPVGEPRLALEAAGHLSYPFVFRHDGVWYMLPESNAVRRIELYRAERFPDRWIADRVLLSDIDAVDATLHEQGDHWYLFTSVGDLGIGRMEELHLFVATSPFGPFAVHPASPVVTDVRRARMAGRIFRHQNRLYRPAQRAVPVYGSGLVVHEITTLTPTDYAERVAYELGPPPIPGVLGVHTINAADGLSVIDLLRPVPR